MSLVQERSNGVSAITRFNRPEVLSRLRFSGQSGLGVWSLSTLRGISRVDGEESISLCASSGIDRCFIGRSCSITFNYNVKVLFAFNDGVFYCENGATFVCET